MYLEVWVGAFFIVWDFHDSEYILSRFCRIFTPSVQETIVDFSILETAKRGSKIFHALKLSKAFWKANYYTQVVPQWAGFLVIYVKFKKTLKVSFVIFSQHRHRENEPIAVPPEQYI
jgi:hypothetical protein